MSGLFASGLPLLNKYFFQLQRLLAMHMPLLNNHLAQQGVEPTIYASKWFMTVCICNFPFSTVVRIWDIFLAEGVKIIFRVASATLIQVALSIKLKNKTLKDIESEWLAQTP